MDLRSLGESKWALAYRRRDISATCMAQCNLPGPIADQLSVSRAVLQRTGPGVFKVVATRSGTSQGLRRTMLA